MARREEGGRGERLRDEVWGIAKETQQGVGGGGGGYTYT